MHLSLKEHAVFETTKRLLAQLINERLVEVLTIKQNEDSNSSRFLLLKAKGRSVDENHAVKLFLRKSAGATTMDGRMTSIVRPETILPPTLLQSSGTQRQVFDPIDVLEHVRPWLALTGDKASFQRFKEELRSSADNQEVWLQMSKERYLTSLHSTMLAWEQSVIYGHPTHPLHRTCIPLPPLKPMRPADIHQMQRPKIAIISVPRADIRTTGNFQELMQPFFEKLGVQHDQSETALVPCLEQQLPIIEHHFPNMSVLRVIEGCANAQASTRTLSLDPELGFPYNVKMALACQITSAIRTVTPWTACAAPFISDILVKLLPPNFWVFKEVASVTGSQDDFDIARHISCVLREELEPRARANGETLAVAAALQERVPGKDATYPELLMGLKSVEHKLEWFTQYLFPIHIRRNCAHKVISYIRALFKAALPPAIRHGIGLELHPQNTVVRIDLQTRKVSGFAIRDFGGIRLHGPTLRSEGVSLDWEIPGSGAVTDDLTYVWDLVSHTLIQCHVAGLLYALDLDTYNGWEVVRVELFEVMNEVNHPNSKVMYEYLTRDTMKLKCFLGMRFQGIYRSNIEIEVPNIILS